MVGFQVQWHKPREDNHTVKLNGFLCKTFKLLALNSKQNGISFCLYLFFFWNWRST